MSFADTAYLEDGVARYEELSRKQQQPMLENQRWWED
jgi:hypothetical protein